MSDWVDVAKNEFKIASVDVDRLRGFADFADSESAGSLLSSVLKMYLEKSPVDLITIGDAVAAEDFSKIHKVAHSLKSSSANLGAFQLPKLLQALEDQTDHGAAPASSEIKTTWSLVQKEMGRVFRDLQIVQCLTEGREISANLLKPNI